jgi:rod shape determining protein RodA
MRRPNESLPPLQRIDWTLAGIYVLLVLFGLVNIYSSSYDPEHPSIFDFSMEYGKQLGWMAFSFVVAGVLLLVEGSFIRKQTWVFYGIIMFMLVAVLFFPPIKGARSWFGWGSVGIQPSEFAKITTSLAIARFLSTINIKLQDFGTKATIAAIIGAPAMLILIQPDPGTLLVFVSFFLMLYREGLSGNILLYAMLIAILSVLTILFRSTTMTIFSAEIPGIWAILGILLVFGTLVFLIIRFFVFKRDRKKYFSRLLIIMLLSNGFVLSVDYAYDHILKDRHRTRIELFLGIQEDPDGKDYNRNRAMAAVGSGGWIGKGYRNATLANAQHGHVPEQSTDFAFCTLSEELGFVGSAMVIILFIALLFRMIIIAERQRSQFTRIYAYCVAGIIFFHFMINIGMTVGLAPVIGIPLPFFSYGGSSLLAFTVLIFILLRLDSERMDVLR